MSFWSRRPIEELCRAAAADGDGRAMPRDIGIFRLTCIGVGCTIGAGIFVLSGTVASQNAGPAVTLSFALAGVVCLLAGLCFAEMASMMPVAGSAYSYSQAALGEGLAWAVGWCLTLEYLFSASLVAIGWSGYTQSTMADLGIMIPAWLSAAPYTIDAAGSLVRTGGVINLPAALVTCICTALLVRGTRSSATFNALIVVLKVVALVVVTAAGLAYVDPARWQPFVPPNSGEFGEFGWSGVLRGTALVFFSYLGFDAVATLGQEAKNPQRAIPVSLFLSLAVCSALYVAIGFLLTGLVDYRQLGVPDPIYLALASGGASLGWAKALIGFLSIVGLVSVLLVALIGQVRIFYAMGRDGLLPAAFARLDPRSGVPNRSTILTGAMAATAAALLPLRLLGELISIGTLLAFAAVCVGVMRLRAMRPELHRPFRVPLYPATPIMGALLCVWLMSSLPAGAWLRLLFWIALGFAVYWCYGARAARRRGPTVSALR